jgi:type II secretory pathway pseudopilin PulG
MPTQVEMATNKQSVYYLAFDAVTTEYSQVSFVMPSDYDAGTITATFYWTHPATTTNFGVTWQCQGYSYGNDDALDAVWGTAQSVSDTGGTTSDVYISSATSAITLGGTPAASEYVIIRINRLPTDGSDTMAVDAYLLGVTLTYTRS